VLRRDLGRVATSPRVRNGSRPRSWMSMVGAACSFMSFTILWMFLNPVHFWSISEDIVTRAGKEDGTRSFGWVGTKVHG